MIDLVGILEAHAATLGWDFSYGNKSNQNLLRSDTIAGKKYMLLDPVRRVKSKSEFGGTGIRTFNGSFMLVVKSTLDTVYHNQKEQLASAGRYELNIKPLLTELVLLEDILDCSDYEIKSWEVIDVINQLDANLDGIIVTFSISSL